MDSVCDMGMHMYMCMCVMSVVVVRVVWRLGHVAQPGLKTHACRSVAVKHFVDMSKRCTLRVFVYDVSVPHLEHQLARGGAFYGMSSDAPGTSCLEAPCQYDTFSAANVRAFTTEVPVYQRIVSLCPRELDPSAADLLLVVSGMNRIYAPCDHVQRLPQSGTCKHRWQL